MATDTLEFLSSSIDEGASLIFDGKSFTFSIKGKERLVITEDTFVVDGKLQDTRYQKGNMEIYRAIANVFQVKLDGE